MGHLDDLDLGEKGRGVCPHSAPLRVWRLPHGANRHGFCNGVGLAAVSQTVKLVEERDLRTSASVLTDYRHRWSDGL